MTMAAATSWQPQARGRSAALWGGAAVVAGLAHGGAVWLALHRPPSYDLAASPPPAVMIELAPEAVAPKSDMMEFAPDLEDINEVLAPDTLEIPDEPTMVEEQPTPTLELPSVTPPPALPPAPVPPTVVPEVVLPPPERKVEKPPPVEAEKAEKPKPPARQERQQAAKSEAAAPAPTAAAPRSGTGTTGAVAPAAWQQKLSAHLNRSKRYPAAARSRRQEGVAQVRIRIDDSGNILSSTLVRSSGFADLDAEAMALMKRASPVPPPPAGIPHTITVPIRFNIQ